MTKTDRDSVERLREKLYPRGPSAAYANLRMEADATLDALLTRADHALALVAAEREACADCCTAELRNISLLTSNPPKSSAAWNARNAIRARTDADAKAALEARDKRVQEEALREALACTTDGDSYRRIEALIEKDQTDE